MFGRARYVTVPLPLPEDDPPIIVSHSTFDTADQVQPAPAVTSTVPLPPRTGWFWLVGEIENVHGTAAAWLRVTVCPATVTVPLRAAPLLAATVSATGPLPVPDAPDVTAIQAALDVAFQVQLPAVVTETEAVPPAAGTFWVGGATTKLHATPSWVTVNVCPAIVSVPVRADPVFAAALKVTDPLPLPDAALVIVSQFALALAVHAHPLAVVTATVPVPPAAPTDWPLDAIE
jgi:hypothetical protein